MWYKVAINAKRKNEVLDKPFQVCERLDRNQSGKQSVFYQEIDEVAEMA